MGANILVDVHGPYLSLRFDYDQSVVEKVRLIPGRRFHRGSCAWLVPLTKEALPELRACLSGCTLQVAPSVAARLEEMAKVESLTYSIKTSATTELPEDMTFPAGYPPYNHQRTALKLISARDQFALFMDQGTGKSYVMLAMLNWLHCKPSLVVCPASVMSVWQDQAAQFYPSLKVEVLSGSIRERVEQLRLQQSDIYVINYEASWRMLDALQAVPWKALTLDECFAGGTLVDTPAGPRRIDSLRPGDLVLNCLGTCKVVGNRVKTLDKRVKISYNKKVVSCSANHPFFTTRGWVPASELTISDRLVTTHASKEIVHGVRKGVSGSALRCSYEEILRDILLGEMEDAPAGDSGQSVYESYGAQVFSRLKKILRVGVPVFYSDTKNECGKIEKGAPPARTRQNLSHPQADKVGPHGTWWERPRPDYPATKASVCSWKTLEDRVFCRGLDAFGFSRVPYLLQVGYSVPESEAGGGGGRVLTPIHKKESTGFEEDGIPGTVRVDRIEVQEQRNPRGTRKGGRGYKFYDLEIAGHPSFSVNGVLVHNSHRIKGRTTAQTKAILKLKVPRRYILSGTPMPNNPLELFAQFKFLDPGIFGPHFYAFRDRYAIMGGYQGYQAIGWKNMDELTAKLSANSYRVLKRDCLDLPDKVYSTIRLEMSGDQKKAYKDMASVLVAELSADKTVSAAVIISKLIKLREIASGFVVCDDGTVHEFKENVKMGALADLVEDLPEGEKMVIWCSFKREIAMVKALLSKSAQQWVEISGDIKIEDRGQLVERFQKDKDMRFLVGQQRAGGLGITLTAANNCVFLSNDYSPEVRLQAEDRLHRIGQATKVTYYDLVCKGTIDTAIRAALRRKQNLSAMVTGDNVLEVVNGKA